MECGISPHRAGGSVYGRRLGKEAPHTPQNIPYWLRTHWCYWEQKFCTHKVQERIFFESGNFQPNSPGSHFTEWFTASQEEEVSGRSKLLHHHAWVCSSGLLTLFTWMTEMPTLYRQTHADLHVPASSTGSILLVTSTSDPLCSIGLPCTGNPHSHDLQWSWLFPHSHFIQLSA